MQLFNAITIDFYPHYNPTFCQLDKKLIWQGLNYYYTSIITITNPLQLCHKIGNLSTRTYPHLHLGVLPPYLIMAICTSSCWLLSVYLSSLSQNKQ